MRLLFILLIFCSPLIAGVANGNPKQCREFINKEKQDVSKIMESKFDDIIKHCGKNAKYYMHPKNNVFYGQLDGKEMRKITDKWAASCNRQKNMRACLDLVNRKMTYLRIVNGGIAGQNFKERRTLG